MSSPVLSAAILYAGPSMLDGSPIVAIMTGHEDPSDNDKTGAIPQVWILRSDIAPHEAIKTGDDSAVCGDCPLRPSVAAKGEPVCYVRTFQAPLSIYRKHERGGYGYVDADSLARISAPTIRIGAYGDPAAVPLHVWDTLASLTGAKILGYSHQWRKVPQIARYAMASVESSADAQEAHALGFRTFRVMSKVRNEAPNRGEALCPASKEAGYRKTCATCGACDGTARGNRASIAIFEHRRKGASRPSTPPLPLPL